MPAGLVDDFTEGPLVYGVRLNGPPGTVTEEQAVEISRAYRGRVADLPAPEAALVELNPAS